MPSLTTDELRRVAITTAIRDTEHHLHLKIPRH
jgi:hypothetical protein